MKIKFYIVLLLLPVLVFSSTLKEQEIKKAIEQYSKKHIPFVDDIRVEMVTIPEKHLEKMTLPVSITCRKHGKIKNRTLFDVVFKKGKKENTFTVLADIKLYKNVPVLTRDVQKGERLNQNYVEKKLEEIVWSSNHQPIEMNAVNGKRTKRLLKKGRVLMENMVEAVPVIMHGETVDMYVASGRLCIKMPVVTVADGRIGEIIKVKKAKGTEIYYATVQDAQTVIFQK